MYSKLLLLFFNIYRFNIKGHGKLLLICIYTGTILWTQEQNKINMILKSVIFEHIKIEFQDPGAILLFRTLEQYEGTGNHVIVMFELFKPVLQDPGTA
jgi:hypothetical protein